MEYVVYVVIKCMWISGISYYRFLLAMREYTFHALLQTGTML
jgi:hypothetical protein